MNSLGWWLFICLAGFAAGILTTAKMASDAETQAVARGLIVIDSQVYRLQRLEP